MNVSFISVPLGARLQYPLVSLNAAHTSARSEASRANLICVSSARLRSVTSRTMPVKKRRPPLMNSPKEISDGIFPPLCAT